MKFQLHFGQIEVVSLPSLFPENRQPLGYTETKFARKTSFLEGSSHKQTAQLLKKPLDI